MNIRNKKALAVLAGAALVLTSCGGSDSPSSSSGGGDATTDKTTDGTMTDGTMTEGTTDGTMAEETTDGTTAEGGGGGTATVVNVDDCQDPEAAMTPLDGDIVYGWTAPTSGPLAGVVGLVLDGVEARLEAENAAGGIDGHMFKMVRKDDAFDPERAKGNISELIDAENATVVSTFGSGQLGAIADEQNINCVPSLFNQASDPELRSIEDYPWTTQYLPASDVETKSLVNLLTQRYPDGAKVAMAVNPTTSGVVTADYFKEALDGTNLELVAEADSSDPDSAATTLSQGGAQILYNAGVATDCPAMTASVTKVGWTPEVFVQPSNCGDGTNLFAPLGDAANGQLILMWLKEPSNPAYDDDPGVQAFREGMEAFGVTEYTSYGANGWAVGELLIDVLKSASASDLGMSPAGIMEAARNQSAAPALFFDGTSFEMTPDSAVGISAFQPMKWDAAEQFFVKDGDVVSADG